MHRHASAAQILAAGRDIAQHAGPSFVFPQDMPPFIGLSMPLVDPVLDTGILRLQSRV